MSNITPPTFNFPEEIGKEYQQLMQSRSAFSENLSRADRAKLAILYERLKSVWELNITTKLSETLERSYQELNQLQEQVGQNWTIYESTIENELKRDIAEKLTKLERAKANSSSALAQRKKKLELQNENWRNDILAREMHLSAEEERLNSLSALSTTLRDLQQQLQQNKAVLKTKLGDLTQESSSYHEIETQLQADLNSLKSRNNQDLKEKQNVYDQRWRESQEDLNKSGQNYQQLLRTAEKEQLKQLRTEIALEIPNLRRDLKDLWIAGELSLIGTMYKSRMTESEKLMTALETNLTKNGINVQDYLDKMDRNITLQ